MLVFLDGRGSIGFDDRGGGAGLVGSWIGLDWDIEGEMMGWLIKNRCTYIGW